MISDTDLLLLNERGFIAGPDETAEDFSKRIAFLEKFEPILQDKLEKKDWETAHLLTKQVFDFSADWIKGFYSNKKLPFWQGAATWIDHPWRPLIQLKKAFRSGNYLKIYGRDEVLAHEALHAARMAFEEPKFEEVLAFATSRYPLRKALGPLLRSSWESYLFIFALFFAMIGTSIHLIVASCLTSLYFLPVVALIIVGIFRHLLIQRIFKGCLKNLRKILKNSSFCLPVVCRLTDREIVSFNKWSSKQILSYVNMQRSLRWRQIFLSYFQPEFRV
ncbi:MAG: hypothetical protein ACM3JI_04660 [Anaerolineae bacterium]